MCHLIFFPVRYVYIFFNFILESFFLSAMSSLCDLSFFLPCNSLYSPSSFPPRIHLIIFLPFSVSALPLQAFTLFFHCTFNGQLFPYLFSIFSSVLSVCSSLSLSPLPYGRPTIFLIIGEIFVPVFGPAC